MARIEGVPAAGAGLLVRLVYWYAKRVFGKVAEPATISAHHRWIFPAMSGYEFGLSRARLVEERLKVLAELKVAALIGCPF